jgi:type IX secretion system substrate protein
VQRNITWASTLVDSVKIELLINDTVFSAISPGVPASPATFGWVITLATPITNQAKIRVTDTKSTLSSTSPAYFEINMYIGVKENDLSRFVSVYPNPSAGNVTVSISTPLQATATATLCDITGREIQTVQVNGNRASLHVEQKGIYLMRIKMNDLVVYKKIAIE